MVTHILYQATVPQNSLYSIKTHVSLSHFLSTVMRSTGTMGFSIYIISPSNYFFTSFSISRGNVCFSFNLSLLHRVAFTAMILLNIISLLPFFFSRLSLFEIGFFHSILDLCSLRFFTILFLSNIQQILVSIQQTNKMLYYLCHIISILAKNSSGPWQPYHIHSSYHSIQTTNTSQSGVEKLDGNQRKYKLISRQRCHPSFAGLPL